MNNQVSLSGAISVEITPQMRWAAYDVLSRWYSKNNGATTGEKMMDLSDEMLMAALNAANPPPSKAQKDRADE